METKAETFAKLHPMQQAYIMAKASFDTLEEQNKNVEKKYIAEHNIKNADGSTPAHIWRIDDMAVFEKANRETEKDCIATWPARKILLAAESKLIEWSLTCFPASAVKGLNHAAQRYLHHRERLVELAMKIDYAKVPKAYRRG